MMKKILIRVPNTINGVILTFPFFHALREEYSDAEINVIVNEDIPDVYTFLNENLNLRIFKFPLKKNSILGIHHFSYNLIDVFNIDLFIDLENTFKSSFMGLAFRSHERVGVATGFNKYFLTSKLQNNIKDIYDEYYLKFLEHCFDKSYDDYKVLGVEVEEDEDESDFVEINEVEHVIEQDIDERYNIIVMSKIDDKLKDFWQDFLECFVSNKFIILNKTVLNNDNFNEVFQDFINHKNNKNNKNKIEIKQIISDDEYCQLVSGADWVVLDEIWQGVVSNYLGAKTFVFVDIKETVPYMKHFKRTPTIIKTKNWIPVRISSDNETKEVFNIGEVVDYIHNELNL